VIDPSAPWLLDLFCCAGGAGVGYARAGFNVIGVDIVPQPHYPFTFVQADALAVLRGQIANLGIEKFAVVHASPPCQLYSNAQRIRDRDHPDLIGPTRALLAPLGVPYVIENVMGARDEMVDPVMLCGAMFPELRVYRHRLFESSIRLTVPSHPKHVHKQTKMGRTPVEGEFIHVVGNFSGVAYARKAMGIDWMVRDELREAIPPAYTEFIGRQLLNSQEVQNRMSRTHRTHLATDDHAARRHTRRRLRTAEERQHKTAKACRAGERAQLREARKEYR
jgi:DNA (cytosine-5)-methyltransferase 1